MVETVLTMVNVCRVTRMGDIVNEKENELLDGAHQFCVPKKVEKGIGNRNTATKRKNPLTAVWTFEILTVEESFVANEKASKSALLLSSFRHARWAPNAERLRSSAAIMVTRSTNNLEIN